MKKSKKLERLSRAMDEKKICRCYFTYDENYYYYYLNALTNKFLLGQEENDFLLDGYCVRKISQLAKAEIKNDKCDEINELRGIKSQIQMPNVDLTSWETLFQTLKELDTFLVIEDETRGLYTIGLVKKVSRKHLLFQEFNADGEWQEELLDIPYSSITSVSWNTRYAQNWEWYVKNIKNENEKIENSNE